MEILGAIVLDGLYVLSEVIEVNSYCVLVHELDALNANLKVLFEFTIFSGKAVDAVLLFRFVTLCQNYLLQAAWPVSSLLYVVLRF